MSAPLTKRERKLKRKLKRVTSAREVTSAPMFRQGDMIYVADSDTYLQVTAVQPGTLVTQRHQGR